MAILNSVSDFIWNKKQSSTPLDVSNLTPQNLYERLDSYYQNNGLYESLQATMYYSNLYIEALKPLRNPVNRSVEFYVSKICPSKVNIISDNEAVKEAINQFYKWSNFGSVIQVSKRQLSLYGDLFLKVVSTDKVYFEVINPKYVTDFETDNRGYLTEIRIDIPVEIEEKQYTHTEYWTKDYYSIWEHQQGISAKLENLGTPDDFSFLAELGIDFIPIVHIKFKDVGNKRGVGCVTHAIEKIDEANREATRLNQLLFRYNKPVFTVQANSTDKDGRPIPAPKIKSNEDNIELKENSILYLPGNSSLQSLIPNINYADALSILNSMLDEIEKDLPELRYYSIQDSNLSGKAIKMLLAGAVDKATEAQDNFLAGLKRLNEMALTIGKNMGLFKNIGSYENGDFEHEIVVPAIFPTSIDETASLMKDLVAAGLSLATALRIAGFSEEEILQAVQEKQAEGVSPVDNLLAQRL